MSDGQLQPGTLVGPYRIVRKIGHGGMAEVYEAWEEALQRRIALKVLSTKSAPDLVKRFQAEGRALARLTHNNIVHIHALGEYEGHVYMAMEYIDGWSLNEFLRSRFCGLPEILDLFRQMLEGLGAAHAAGVIHRDLKPQNVMVDRALGVKLVDFGIARLLEDQSGGNTVTGMIFGTLDYIPPEIINGGEASEQSDIYSLGLVLYCMLTGKSPFAGQAKLEVMGKILNAPLVLSPEVKLILPASLKKIIFRMTTKSLPARYRNVNEVLAALAKVDFNALPRDLRASGGQHWEIADTDEIWVKCKRVGLGFLETALVVNLAAEIVLKAGVGSDGAVHIGDPILSEAVRRFVSAKRRMILKRAYLSLNFKIAAGALTAALTLAAVVFTASPGKLQPGPAARVLAENRPVSPPPITAPAPTPASPSRVVRMKAPVPVSPVDRAVLAVSQATAIRLEWRPTSLASSYEITVRSKDSGFVKKLHSKSLSARLAEIPSGNYVWSVRPLDENGKRGPHSGPSSFSVTPERQTRAPASITPADASFQKPVLLPPVIEKRGQ